MKNIFKKAGKGLLAFSILANTFMPLGSVFADGTYTVTINVEDTAKYQIEKDNSEGHEKEMVLTIAGAGDRHIGITEGGSGTGDVSLVCPTTAQCVYTVPNGKTIAINYNSEDIDITGNGENAAKYNPDHNYNDTITVVIKEPSGDTGNHFDGHAFLIWSCGTGTCFHEFTDIPPFDDGNSKFYKDTEVTADNDPSKHFDVKAQYKGWALPDKLGEWANAYMAKNNILSVDDIVWTEVDASTLVGDPPDMREWEDKAVKAGTCNKTTMDREEFETCVDNYYVAQGNLPFVKLQPVGEPEYENCYVSYGDRNFKVVIYNENYKGIAMGDLNELEYYPSSWTNPFLRRDQFDLSGSTKDKPALLDSILLESKVIIKSLNKNGFEIASIEPLDVPEGAVVVDEESGAFEIYFNSNFYDNVVFKVTDSNGEESYMKIKRYTIDAWFRNLENEPYLYADFYFDKELSYTNFDITAKIVYKDGTVKNVVLSPYGKVDDGLDNWSDEPEVDLSEPADPNIPAGKGLKQSAFVYKLSKDEDKKISKIYLNAEYKGSTAEKYAGAYVGSGLGTLANIYTGEEE